MTNSNSVIKWKTYCNSEEKYVFGYLDDADGFPIHCFNNKEHSIDKSKSISVERIHKHYTKSISYWKLYCDTEQTYVYGYKEEEPEKCFNNQTHILSKRPILQETFLNNNQTIKEEDISTGGNIQFKSLQFSIPSGNPGDKTIFEHSFLYPISIISINLLIQPDNIGDIVEADIAHNTTVGIITENISSGVTEFTVSDTVINNLNIGYNVFLNDGVHTNVLGSCIFIDKTNKKIATEFSTTNDFLLNSPTYLQQTVKLIDKIHIVNTHNLLLGSDKIGASYIPKNIPGRMIYTNNNGLEKTFTFLIQYLY